MSRSVAPALSASDPSPSSLLFSSLITTRNKDRSIAGIAASSASTALRRAGGVRAPIPDPIKWHVTDWHADPLFYGSYSYIPLNASVKDVKILCKPEGTLFLAGEGTNHRDIQTVHGAYASGIRAAEYVHAHAWRFFDPEYSYPGKAEDVHLNSDHTLPGKKMNYEKVINWFYRPPSWWLWNEIEKKCKGLEYKVKEGRHKLEAQRNALALKQHLAESIKQGEAMDDTTQLNNSRKRKKNMNGDGAMKAFGSNSVGVRKGMKEMHSAYENDANWRNRLAILDVLANYDLTLVTRQQILEELKQDYMTEYTKIQKKHRRSAAANEADEEWEKLWDVDSLLVSTQKKAVAMSRKLLEQHGLSLEVDEHPFSSRLNGYRLLFHSLKSSTESDFDDIKFFLEKKLNRGMTQQQIEKFNRIAPQLQHNSAPFVKLLLAYSPAWAKPPMWEAVLQKDLGSLAAAKASIQYVLDYLDETNAILESECLYIQMDEFDQNDPDGMEPVRSDDEALVRLISIQSYANRHLNDADDFVFQGKYEHNDNDSQQQSSSSAAAAATSSPTFVSHSTSTSPASKKRQRGPSVSFGARRNKRRITSKNKREAALTLHEGHVTIDEETAADEQESEADTEGMNGEDINVDAKQKQQNYHKKQNRQQYSSSNGNGDMDTELTSDSP